MLIAGCYVYCWLPARANIHVDDPSNQKNSSA
jgi:hypothetical protein